MVEGSFDVMRNEQNILEPNINKQTKLNRTPLFKV